MNQEERLNYLVEEFIKDSDGYQDLQIPDDTAGKKRVLRSLMNIRMPKKMDSSTLAVQDAYLRERNGESGIVKLKDIPTVREQGSAVKHGDVISVWQGDITTVEADAIVNAANAQMLGCFVPMHTCIDNCIHTYAGIQLREECSRKMKQLRKRYGEDYEQPTAVPMLTEGYNLPAKKVIHIVGPIVGDRLTKKLEQDLADCYTATLDLCLKNGLRSVVFCGISTGVFRFSKDRAAQIAVKTVSEWLDEHPYAMDRVIFNVFREKDRANYESQLF